MTAEVLQKAIRSMLAQQRNKQPKQRKGKQSLRQLRKHGASLSNVEITEENIKSFSKVAKEFKIDFALKKDPTAQPPHYIVFFKGSDKDTLEQAFKKFAYTTLNRDKKPSIRKLLTSFKETVQGKNVQRSKEKSKDKEIVL